MSGQVSRGSADEYQADEWAGVAGLSSRDGRRCTIMIKSNPIPTRWVTYKLENDNTKEVLPLL